MISYQNNAHLRSFRSRLDHIDYPAPHVVISGDTRRLFLLNFTFPRHKSIYQLIIPLALLILLVFSILAYKIHIEYQAKLTVTEHADLLAEALWNFNFITVHEFLDIFIARSEYQNVHQIDSEGKLIAESHSASLNSVKQLFSRLHVITIQTVSADIVF